MQKALIFVVSCTIIGAVLGAAGDACIATGTTTVGQLPEHCTAGVTIIKADASAAFCDCTTPAAQWYESTAGSATANSVLTQCHQACATCNAGGNDKCTSCAATYQADTTAANTVSTTTAGKCCPKTCATCATESTRTTDPLCTACATGNGVPKLTTISATAPAACTACTGTGCLTCDTTSPATAGVCTSCPSAFFASADNKTCTACPSNCTSCPNATFCTTCNGSLQWNNGSQKCFGSALKVGSVVGSLLAVAVFALVF